MKSFRFNNIKKQDSSKILILCVYYSNKVDRVEFEYKKISNNNKYDKKIKFNKKNFKTYSNFIVDGNFEYIRETDEIKYDKEYMVFSGFKLNSKKLMVYFDNDIKYAVSNKTKILNDISKFLFKKFDIDVFEINDIIFRFEKYEGLHLKWVSDIFCLKSFKERDIFSLLLNYKIDFDVITDEELVTKYYKDDVVKLKLKGDTGMYTKNMYIKLN